jgi:acyl-CoA reductase-like NAD-dependent aldehyde dehydrogenase
VDVRPGDCGTGNAFILKPSERDPSARAAGRIDAGSGSAQAGMLQCVHGDKEMVDAILDHPEIGAAVSFVGSSDIAHYVYQRGVAAGKRVQAMGGAKNHGIVMPDADIDRWSTICPVRPLARRRTLHGAASCGAGRRGHRRPPAREADPGD